jgi:hypothetical protein
MSWHEDTPYNPNGWMQDPLLSAWYERVTAKHNGWFNCVDEMEDPK